MFLDKITRILLVISLLFLSSSLCCKKAPTSPEVDDVTRPVIWLSSFEMSFTASVTGGNPSSQILKVKNAGPNTLDYSLEVEANWLSVSPTSSTSTGQTIDHTVSVDKTELTAQDDNYSAKIIVKCSQAYNNPQQVNVSLQITKEPPPIIWVDTQQLTFNAQEGGLNPPFQNIKIKNNGEGSLHYELSTDTNWLSVNPQSGTSQGAIQTHKVSIDISGLNTGTYNAKVIITDSNASNSPQQVSVTLNIDKNLPPKIWMSPKNFTFTAIDGGTNPSSKSLSIRNDGCGTLKYSIDWNASWLSVNPDSGQSYGDTNKHTVSVDAGGLSTGIYKGTITITDPKASNSPQIVNVTLELDSPPTDNKISVSCNPSSGGTNTIVSISILIKGNLQDITVFGLDMTFDPNIFQFQSVGKGTLTGNWAAVDGNEISSGTLKIGGFAGSASPISKGSTGSIAIVKLKVISTASSNKQTQICIKNYIDHISGMSPSTTCTTFTYQK